MHLQVAGIKDAAHMPEWAQQAQVTHLDTDKLFSTAQAFPHPVTHMSGALIVLAWF